MTRAAFSPLAPANLAGVAIAVFLAALTLGTLAVVAVHAGGGPSVEAADWAALRFTLLQASLSAALSTALAIPVARALARQSFPGRRVLILLMGAPFILPVIVAVIGLASVYGRTGWLSSLSVWLGGPRLDIYGLTGVVLAHVFFNLPLVTRLLLQGWQAIPAEHFRLAAMLGWEDGAISRHLERPMLRQTLPGAFAMVFLLCCASFAVALILGGGPRATTLELAIYQAFRFDFDLAKAAFLAAAQFAICAGAALLAWRLARPVGFGSGLDPRFVRFDGGNTSARLVDGLVLTVAALFLLVPLLAVALKGLGGFATLGPAILPPLLRSIAVALGSAALTLGMAIFLGGAVVRMQTTRPGTAGLAEASAYFAIAASPMVIGTGLFLVIFPLADPARFALPLTALVNAAMSLPFALRALLPAIRRAHSDFAPLADSLGLTGITRFRLVTWPRIRPEAGFATGLAAALSMGDLGVVALFADPEAATLPLFLYRLMGSYQMDQAAAAALVLLAASLALFWSFDQGDHHHAGT